MSGRLDLLMAERRGSKTAERSGFAALPVNPRVIAAKHEIVVEERPLKGCFGCLVKQGDQFGILYSSDLANEGTINFTIAHELGHYFLDGHPEALFPNGFGAHQSAGAFRSSDPREREADHFAVGLLMPETQFVKSCRRAGEGLDAVETLAGICGTSLTATAIRYATLSDTAAAVIVALNGRVEFCIPSESLRRLRGLTWPRRGDQVVPGTQTSRLSRDPGAIERAERRCGGCTLSDWFDGAPEVDCQEEVVGLGRFGQTLTLLWSDEDIEPEDDESEDCD